MADYQRLYESLQSGFIALQTELAAAKEQNAVLRAEKKQWELEKITQQRIIQQALDRSNATSNGYLEENQRLKEEIHEFESMTEQFCRDLNGAHDEIVRLQGEDPARFDWPVWTPQATSIRWAEKKLDKPLAKTRKRL